MKTIKEIGSIKGKRVLVRVDFNVPVVKGKIIDDFRIKKSLKTIEYLKDKGAVVILIAHLGEDGSQSFESILSGIKKHIKGLVFIKTPILLDATAKTISNLPNGSVVLMENIRREAGEKKNDVSFARGLSRIGDLYVNDAFSVSHREHSSIVGLPKFLPSYAGFQLENEITELSSLFEPKHPFVFILGGAKFETKIPLIKRFVKTADTIFVGGALMNDFLKVKGYEVGQSKVEEGNFNLKFLLKNSNIIIPEDVEVASGNKKRFTGASFVGSDETIVDVGPQSIKTIEEKIIKSKMVLFNGPMGKYEDGFGGATEKLLKIISKTKTKSIVGGGDTVALVSKLKLDKKISFVSTGGGATLDFLAKGTLPGIKALK